MTTPTRRGYRAIGAVVIAVAGIVTAGCGDGGEGGVSARADTGSEVPIDSLFDVIDSIAGPTVEDTEIRFVEGSDTVSVGGLALTDPLFVDYYEVVNRTVPPTWPTLAELQLFRHNETSAAVFGFAVFRQTTLVTDADSRTRLIADGFAVGQHENSEVVHESELTNPETGVTCWTEVRYGKIDDGFDPSHRAVVMFAGPGIASSGMIVWAPSSFTRVPEITGDIVESVCGSRPDGL